MTSSIFLPRRSLAWPEPRTHLMESTMFVLPEPFGPTMAVTPPSNWISVCRAKVLKPSNCRDLRNKTGAESSRRPSPPPSARLLVGGAHAGTGRLVDRLAELPAAGRLGGRLQRHDLGGRRGRSRFGCRIRQHFRRSLRPCNLGAACGLWLALGARRAARSRPPRRLGDDGQRRCGRRGPKRLERRTCGVLLSLLLARAVTRAERLGAGEDDRGVLAPVADPRALAVVHRRRSEPLLRDLLQATLEVL